MGNHVVGLHRERIGDILLDESLAPGEYRPLTEAEIASGRPAATSKNDAEAEFFTGDCVLSLGLLAMLMLLSIDMYLPALPVIAAQYNVPDGKARR